MSKKTLTIETKAGKNYFEIEEYKDKYILSKVIYSLSFFGSTKREKIGEAKRLDDAITLAKTTISGSIINTNID
jgi:hypothetical protein